MTEVVCPTKPKQLLFGPLQKKLKKLSDLCLIDHKILEINEK